MDAIKAIKTRKSIRAYKNKKIPAAVLKEIVECAGLSATAMNIQPWEFVLVTGRSRLEEISGCMTHSQFAGNAAACIFVLSRETEYWLEDCSAATETILIAANAKGISSCWIAGDKQPFAQKLLKLLGAPGKYKLASIVALGYADESPKNQEKRKLKDILHMETF